MNKSSELVELAKDLECRIDWKVDYVEKGVMSASFKGDLVMVRKEGNGSGWMGVAVKGTDLKVISNCASAREVAASAVSLLA